MDHSTHTTRVWLHPGPPQRGYRCGAMLDSGSPASFITSNALGTMRAHGAVSDEFITTDNNRSWGGFANSKSLTTTKMVRLTVQFYHGATPSAALSLWAHVVPPNSLDYPLILGRGSYMRFNNIGYRQLPPKLVDNYRVFGEYTFNHHDPRGAEAYIQNPTAQGDQFQLRFAGTSGVSLSDEPQMLG